ncbi:hypothetical protein [Streptomyces pulveraceus]|uniref:Uncharacterized protein n=1 Tax=Streptomyces pulveraceus TaxID=68258 RepID=A0ABW1GXV7_9ACTN
MIAQLLNGRAPVVAAYEVTADALPEVIWPGAREAELSRDSSAQLRIWPSAGY